MFLPHCTKLPLPGPHCVLGCEQILCSGQNVSTSGVGGKGKRRGTSEFCWMRNTASKQSAFTISICLQLMKIYFKNLNNFIEERREFYAQRGHGMDFKRIKKFWFKPLRLGTLRDSAQPPGKYSSKILASFLTSCLFMSVLKSLALREGFIFLVCLHQFSLIKP